MPELVCDKLRQYYALLVLLLLCSWPVFAQAQSSSADAVSVSQPIDSLTNQATSISDSLDFFSYLPDSLQQNVEMLDSLQRQHQKIEQALVQGGDNVQDSLQAIQNSIMAKADSLQKLLPEELARKLIHNHSLSQAIEFPTLSDKINNISGFDSDILSDNLTGLPKKEIGELKEVLPDNLPSISNIPELPQSPVALDSFYVSKSDSLIEQQAIRYLEIELAEHEGGELLNQPDSSQLMSQLLGVDELEGFNLSDPRQSVSQAKDVGLNEIKEKATDYLDGYQPQLNKARNKLGKLKGRYGKVKSVKELKELPYLQRHPLHNTPWQQRIVYGLQWQLGREQSIDNNQQTEEKPRYRIDIGPRLSYKVTDQWELGFYGQARLTLGKRVGWLSYKEDPVWGGGAFISYQVKKGFFVQAAYERLSVLVVGEALATPNEKDNSTREVAPGLRLGVGKSYTLYKQLQGYSLIEYNLTNNPYAPYRKQLQVKMGVRLL